MDVRTITLDYLRRNQFDGLYCEDACACKLDDLFPCCGTTGPLGCQPGYLQPQELADAEGYEFMIGPERAPVDDKTLDLFQQPEGTV